MLIFSEMEFLTVYLKALSGINTLPSMFVDTWHL